MRATLRLDRHNAAMLRSALRTAARAGRRAQVAAAGAAAAAGRAHVGTFARLLESGGPSVNAAALAAMAVTMGGSVALAASNQERSFIMVKPDGVHRALVGDIIKRFEAKGYKLVGIKVIVPSANLAKLHYAEHEGKPFFPKLVDFLTSGAVVAMVWEGKDVVKYGRTMIGATNPLASAPGTIRGDFGVDVGRNIIHGSDSIDSAQREIALWFNPDELADYEVATKAWIYE